VRPLRTSPGRPRPARKAGACAYSEHMSLPEAGQIPGDAPDQLDQALKRSAAAGSRGFFFDFDGVLAPIRTGPGTVEPVPGVVEQLIGLAPCVTKLAVVSARQVRFLARHLGQIPALTLYGMYGLEASAGGEIWTEPAAQEWIGVIDAVRGAAVAELGPEVYVEDKRLAVALHYRQHPEHRDQVERWAHARATEHGLAEQSGRMVVELKPPVGVDKGTVLRNELGGLACAWYFGDDISDARAFAAIRDRQRQDPSFTGVCVAVRNAETGQNLASQADLVLPGPEVMPSVIAAAVTAFRAVG
jgi:trehalose 6-phosphate phosphatase